MKTYIAEFSDHELRVTLYAGQSLTKARNAVLEFRDTVNENIYNVWIDVWEDGMQVFDHPDSNMEFICQPYGYWDWLTKFDTACLALGVQLIPECQVHRNLYGEGFTAEHAASELCV